MEKLTYENFPGFAAWWELYPNTSGKRKAFEAWVKRGLESEEQGRLIKALRFHMKTDQWTKDDGRYVPHAATYLNERRDEDDIDQHSFKNENCSGSERFWGEFTS